LIATIFLSLDQFSRAVIIQVLPLGSAVVVTGYFSIIHILNPGAAFSFLVGASGWQPWLFILVALVASAILATLIRQKPPASEVAGYALILAGALGNLVDRVLRRAVADWLDFHWGAAHWPAFNLADVWITPGAASIVIVFAGVGPGTRKTASRCARA